MTIQWDKTQNTWHTDVDKVGRYSVRRVAPRQNFGAFLNNKAITSVKASKNVDEVKRSVEERIQTARDINAGTMKLGGGMKTIQLERTRQQRALDHSLKEAQKISRRLSADIRYIKAYDAAIALANHLKRLGAIDAD